MTTKCKDGKGKLIPTRGKWEVCRRRGLEGGAGPGDGVRQVRGGGGAAGKEGRRGETEGRGTRKWQGKGGEERARGGACVPAGLFAISTEVGGE